MSQSSHKLGTLQTDLKCKNGCGYFGNPEWQGYCSKCHRDLNQKTERMSKKASKKVVRSYSDVQDTNLSLGFSKFEEKKKQQTEKKANTLKNIMKRGNTLKENNSQSPSKDIFPGGDSSIEDLHFKDSVNKDVMKNIRLQNETMKKYSDKTIDEQSEIMQDFYNAMLNRANSHNIYKDLSSEQIDQLMDKIEELLMNNLQRNIIQQITSEYEEKDLELQDRIRNLNWITPQHLGLEMKEASPEVCDLIDKAITDVIEMDSKIAPQEKINCIVKCSKSIFNIINMCQGVTAGADEFLPTMVYIVLKANPPLLQSNIKYITSFSTPARLRSGEGAYYFTNLCCAVEFIDTLTCESLNMIEEEFQRYMTGQVPLTSVEPDATASEGLRLMTQNFNSLSAIQDKTNEVMENLLNLKNDLMKFEETIRKCKSSPPVIINDTPYTVPSNVDMGLIPEILRKRVVRAPLEAVLVDLDSQSEQSLQSTTIPETPYLLDASQPLSPIESTVETDVSNIPVQAMSDLLQPLHVVLPLTTPDFSSGEASTLSSKPLVSSCIPQQYVNIQDLEYPTDLFPETKSGSVEFGPFESCETAETCDDISEIETTRETVDPLSPESSFSEQNLQLPPPLQPVVVCNINQAESTEG